MLLRILSKAELDGLLLVLFGHVPAQPICRQLYSTNLTLYFPRLDVEVVHRNAETNESHIFHFFVILFVAFSVANIQKLYFAFIFLNFGLDRFCHLFFDFFIQCFVKLLIEIFMFKAELRSLIFGCGYTFNDADLFQEVVDQILASRLGAPETLQIVPFSGFSSLFSRMILRPFTLDFRRSGPFGFRV